MSVLENVINFLIHSHFELTDLMQKRKFRAITLVAEIFILVLSFLTMVLVKPSGLRSYIPSHSQFFVGLALIWIAVSMLNGKLHRGKIVSFQSLFSHVISSNFISISITALIMYSFRNYDYSRTVVLGTALVATVLELLAGSVYIAYKRANIQNFDDTDRDRKPSEFELVQDLNGNGHNGNGNGNGHNGNKQRIVSPGIARAIERECGKEMAQAVIEMTSAVKLTEHRTAVLSTTSLFNINSLPEEKYFYIINLHKINDIKNLDSFIEGVNAKLENYGFFLCCVETKDQRKTRLLNKYPPVLNYIYYSLDFIVKRILPKLKFTRPAYTFLTHGQNAVLSRAEALGRLSRGGFRIVQESFIGNRLCIEAKKWKEPYPVNENVNDPLIALPRVGRNGRIIKVYKLRTMHPYSEYIQGYVYSKHDLKEGGKFKNDFRITSWGSICRRIWLDELPMLINFLKGDMKLVGVRPLSRQYFELYDQEVRDRRINYKPGLIPPYYADMPSNLEHIQASEMKYLDSYDRQPLLTDMQYLARSVKNIVFRKARSN